ncbi:uncharacterized protein LOC110990446 [Acanthaster planci]|uniref:Uncharacterized protein LOC110990446 n=1 Tax=Acanthaster planci TaxID=133434 RepID=A0A8B8A5C2_ACAPL|nr:uncharacterized protein LOC110990446 [Acanthaster planci]
MFTGAGGRHCCLYCNINKDNMWLPRGERPPSQQRTLESLNQDLHRFKTAGSNISKAEHFNNVINEPMFAIPLTQVCPSGLHISLRLYLKYFNSFEGAGHDLDMQAAAVLAEKDQGDHGAPALGSGYQKLISVLKVAQRLEQQAEALDEELKLMEDQLTDIILALDVLFHFNVSQKKLTALIKWYKQRGLTPVYRQWSGPSNAVSALDVDGYRYFVSYMNRSNLQGDIYSDNPPALEAVVSKYRHSLPKVDATNSEGFGRMVNDGMGFIDSCKVQLMYDHLCLFATVGIPQDTELRFDYGVTNQPWRKV